jgi:hypothetical protein
MKIIQAKLGLFCMLLPELLSAPAFGQVDFTGQWESLYHEDAPERLPGPELGDYLGMPLNESGRLRADSYDAHPMGHQHRLPQAIRRHQMEPDALHCTLMSPTQPRIRLYLY